MSQLSPLADRARPRTFDDIAGQTHLFGQNGILRRMVGRGVIPSMIFFGPPGCGKTTAASIIAAQCGKTLHKLNATTASLQDIRDVAKACAARGTLMEIINRYDALSMETEDIRSKSQVISTAIINAEKCASTLISDANIRAQDMITEAEDKVQKQVKKLETAKKYITEVRASVESTLTKIDAELSGISEDITVKTEYISADEDKKTSVREKFEMLEKSIFKRA